MIPLKYYAIPYVSFICALLQVGAIYIWAGRFDAKVVQPAILFVILWNCGLIGAWSILYLLFCRDKCPRCGMTYYFYKIGRDEGRRMPFFFPIALFTHHGRCACGHEFCHYSSTKEGDS